MTLALGFDFETTGKGNFQAKYSDPAQPEIVQAAYRLIELETGKVFLSRCAMIKPEFYQEIPEEAQAIHGIDIESARKYGLPLNTVMKEFFRLYDVCDFYFCHNTGYDERLARKTAMRMQRRIDWDKKKFCTMTKTTKLCGIKGPRGMKWPSLQELHMFLFGEGFEAAHDALIDIIATEKCLLELYNKKHIDFSDFKVI